MLDLQPLEAWFVTGSQHLYGPKTLETVADHSRQIAKALAGSRGTPVKLVYKGVLTTPESIYQLCLEANGTPNCIGLIAWMHTFSPAKMWIHGLKVLAKPLAHFHTQFNQELPWSTIDMDFMNLNQSAHGDREFGFITARMGIVRKVIVGFWQDESVIAELGCWLRAAAAWHDWQRLKIARFGDNMRNVAVTEGDKVEAEIRLGFSVNGYGVGDLANAVREVSDSKIDKLAAEYDHAYKVAKTLRSSGEKRQALREAARIELGLRAFLQAHECDAFTDTFEDLHGLAQLPGIAVQRLMAEGYGFGAEGDWKTAALVRAMKVMSAGLPGGTSFMEDYTYHFGKKSQVLGAHMLEICPSIAAGQPSLEIHPLSIGGKADPVRLVFDSTAGPAVNVSLIDLGHRFRVIANQVNTVAPEHSLPRLPVARALWMPEPDLKTAAHAWILAGGAHHTGFSLALNAQHIEDFAQMAQLEFLLIDRATNLRQFQKEIRHNEAYFALQRR